MKYERTSGYRNWVNRLCWAPFILEGVAHLKSGARYEIRRDGWRRLPDEKKVIR